MGAVATLVLINGPPAVGKSTLARRFVDDHPLALNLDIDVVRGLLGRWIEQPNDAGLAARSLAIAMVDTHLRSGRHVIVPQLVGRVEFIEQLEAAAHRVGAQFVEIALMATRQEVSEWLKERSRHPSDQTHVDAARLIERSGLPDPANDLYDAFLSAIAGRPRTIRADVIRGDIDATYELVAYVLDHGPE
jgi:predicted kinase